jgi:site-specific DNA recombinase
MQTCDVIKCVIYLRISQDRTGDGAGVERQRDDALALATRRGWTVVDIITDNDVSASGRKRREGFETALEMITEGEAQVLVAWSLDRLTRNMRDMVRLIETCQEREATVALVQGSDIDMATPAGRMTAGILAMVAKNETDMKSERQKRANLQRAESGQPHISGHRPFGFEVDGITVRESEAVWVRKAYALALAGRSLASITRDLNAADVLTSTGRRWTALSLRALLLRARNAGIREHKGVEHAGAWESIVPEEEYRAVKRMLTDPSRRKGPGGKVHKHLGSRLYVCSCGSLVRAAYRGDKRREYRCLECGKSRQADAIDAYIEEVVIQRLSRPDAVDLLDRGAEIDVMALRAQADALRDERRSLLSLIGTFTEAEIRTEASKKDVAIAALESQIADAGKRDILAPLIGADDVRAVWDGMRLDTRRAVVDTLMTVRLLPTARGVRGFKEDSVQLTPKRTTNR